MIAGRQESAYTSTVMPGIRFLLRRLQPPRRIGSRAIAVFALCLALGPTTAAGLDVSVEPEAPVWEEPLTVRVGDADDCAGHALSEPELGFDSSQDRFTVDIDLIREACAGTNPPVPFSVEREIGRLEPGFWTVRIHDGHTVTSTELTVHGRADLDLVPPAAPFTDAVPVQIQVTGVERLRCTPIQVSTVEAGVIELEFRDHCGLVPPGNPPTPFVETVDVGSLAPGTWEVRIFDVTGTGDGKIPATLTKRELVVYDEDRCLPSGNVLCFQDGLFAVGVEWRDFQGGSGSGHAVRLPGRDDTGFFWFFDESNIELTVKILRACPVNGHYWVFISSGSTVEYHLTVTHSVFPTLINTYSNESGQVPELIADTTAFPCPVR